MRTSKRSATVKTLGSTTVICTDTTGTLTQNGMTVREVFVPATLATFDDVGDTPVGAMHPVEPMRTSGDDVRMLLTAGALASNARVVETDGRWTVLGDPTNAAVPVAGTKAGIDLAEAALMAPHRYELPFDARHMRMSTVHRIDNGDVLYTKGAPGETIPLCALARVEGVDVPMDDDLRARIVAANDDMARRGLGVLAVARRKLDDVTEPLDGDRPPEWWEHDLTFLGLVAMVGGPTRPA